TRHIDLHLARLSHAPLRPDVSPQEIRSHLSRYDFREPQAVGDVFADVTGMLWGWSEHAGTPAHLGLFRPAVDRTAVLAEALAALYDPNLATWGFSPAGAGYEGNAPLAPPARVEV